MECPHCHTIHNPKLWGKGNAFWHYNGLYCPACEGKLPTLLNVFSILILMVTFPLWKPLQLVFGERIKAWELNRLRRVAQSTANETAPFNGMKAGLFFWCRDGIGYLIPLIISRSLTKEALLLTIRNGCAVRFLIWSNRDLLYV